MITTKDGVLVGMYSVESKEHDSQILQRTYHDLPAESYPYGDSGYTDYELEYFFKKTEQVNLQITRKTNSKRKDRPYVACIKEVMRKIIEKRFREFAKIIPGDSLCIMEVTGICHLQSATFLYSRYIAVSGSKSIGHKAIYTDEFKTIEVSR